VLSEVVLLACKDLIDDAKIGCADMVFKDMCLEILAKAKLVLSNEQFEELTFFVAERMKEERIPSSGRKVRYDKKSFSLRFLFVVIFLFCAHLSQ